MVGLAFGLPNVGVDISVLTVVVDSGASAGVVVGDRADGVVVVASLGAVSVVFSVVSFPFLDVVATENSIGIFASQCIILHLNLNRVLNMKKYQ